MSTNDNYPSGSIPTEPVLRRHYISTFLATFAEENGDPPTESVLTRHYQTTLVSFILDHADSSVEEPGSDSAPIEIADTPPVAESSPPPVASESTLEPEITPEPETTQKSGTFLGWLRGLFGG